MRSVVTKQGQTVIPAAIRRRYHLDEGDQLVWIDDGEGIRVVPLVSDPISALRGCGRGERLVEQFLSTRQEEQGR
jgi:AbrB family looped-hinge helix DNA binding protein